MSWIPLEGGLPDAEMGVLLVVNNEYCTTTKLVSIYFKKCEHAGGFKNTAWLNKAAMSLFDNHTTYNKSIHVDYHTTYNKSINVDNIQ